MTIGLDDILDSHRTGRAVVMGVLNVTPDSFSDGGKFLAPAVAVAPAYLRLRSRGRQAPMAKSVTVAGSGTVSMV